MFFPLWLIYLAPSTLWGLWQKLWRVFYDGDDGTWGKLEDQDGNSHPKRSEGEHVEAPCFSPHFWDTLFGQCADGRTVMFGRRHRQFRSGRDLASDVREHGHSGGGGLAVASVETGMVYGAAKAATVIGAPCTKSSPSARRSESKAVGSSNPLFGAFLYFTPVRSLVTSANNSAR
jgi:hypothetical protein